MLQFPKNKFKNKKKINPSPIHSIILIIKYEKIKFIIVYIFDL